MTDAEGHAPPVDLETLAEETARLQEELDALKADRSQAKAGRRRRIRGIAAGVLVVLTSVAVLAAVLGVWAQRTLASEDRFVALVAPLAEDPAVTDALAVRLTDELFVALDVQARVESALEAIPNLPPAAEFLAGPITSGAQNAVEDGVMNFLASDDFADLWTDVVRVAHTKVVALLNGDYDELPNVDVNGGEVQLNLVSMVAAVIQRLAQQGVDALGIDVTVPSVPADLDASDAIDQLGSALGVSLPADFGQVTIMSADELGGYQDTVRTIKRLVWLLVALSLVLLAVTIAVAPDRRRIVIWLAVGIAVVLLLGGVFLRRIESRVVDGITRPGAKAAVQDIFDEVQSSLRGAGLGVALVALAAGIAAYLLGRPPWFERTVAWARSVGDEGTGTRLDAWVAGHADAVRIGAVAVAVVVLFLTGIDWVPVAIVGVLLGLLWWGVAVAERRGRPAEPAAG